MTYVWGKKKMANYCVLYNPISANGSGKLLSERLKDKFKTEKLHFENITEITDLAGYVAAIPSEEELILCGGDGTLNRFLNSAREALNTRKLYYYPCGTGNDFWNDIEKNADDGPEDISEYIRDLPTVTVNGEKRYFINGIGYGIDGYCCEVADKIREKGTNKAINYTTIAIKGLLFHYKPRKATVEVDGKTYEFKETWLAPGMLGRYFGGGMMPTPAQKRLNKEHTLSCMLFHGVGKLRALMIFPKLFKGEHVKYKEHCAVLTGKSITVRYDKPVALQIDGETVLNVSEYTINAAC